MTFATGPKKWCSATPCNERAMTTAATDTTVDELLDSMSSDELARVVARRGRVGVAAFLEALHFDLDSAIERLEANAHRVQADDEEKLTNFLSVQLAAAGYDASCETDVRGHADLRVENR